MRRVPGLFVAACIAMYFFALAGGGLRAGISHDDLRNVYFAWILPLSSLVKSNLLFFQPPPRSLGNLFYALCFRSAGLDPKLYHAVCMLFLAANVWLVYCFTRRLTGSREIAAVACLLHAYHGSAAALYYNTGMCYDVLCFFFYFSAFTYYLSIRQSGRNPSVWEIVLLSLLYIAALNAKEMAVTLPIMIGLYEALFHPKDRRPARAITAAVLGVIVVAYVGGTTRGSESLTNLPHYQVNLSPSAYLAQTGSYLNDLIYSENLFNNARSLALLSTLLALAWWSHDRRLQFCWTLIVIGVLPIGFIPPRGLYAVYIPMVGLAIFAAIFLAKLSSRLENDFDRAALFIAAAAVLGVIHYRAGALNIRYILSEQNDVDAVIEQVKQTQPKAPPASRFLLLKDPFEDSRWDSTFLVRSFYRDNSIEVDQRPDGHDPKHYDFVWSFEQGKLLQPCRTADAYATICGISSP